MIKIYNMDVMKALKQMPDKSVDMQITSPPYWGLRNYDIDGQIGLEKTFDLYIKKLCDIFDEVKRVLKDDGTCWVNIGDTYARGHIGGSIHPKGSGVLKEGAIPQIKEGRPQGKLKGKYREKCLICIPERFVLEMINRGWILRNKIIWYKRNCLSYDTVLYAKTQRGIFPQTLKDLVRLNPKTVKLWDGEKWNQVEKWIKNNNPHDVLKINLRSGEEIRATLNHKFKITMEQNRLLHTNELKKGMILESCTLPDNKKDVELIPDDIGWLIGLYLAEGSKGDNEKCLQFCSHIKETERYKKLKIFAGKYDERCLSFKRDGNCMSLNIYIKVLKGIIDSYISGKNAKTKHLTTKSWQRNNEFLKNILKGYLSGDGHFDKSNNRFRLSFTRNDFLANDLRTICARLNYKIYLKKTTSKIENKEYPSYMGEIRFKKSNHFNSKSQYEIISIEKDDNNCVYYDIVLEKKPHLFSTNSGTLIHNCMPTSVKDRFKCSWEYLFFFSKNKKYFFDLDVVRVPHKTESLERRDRKINAIKKYGVTWTDNYKRANVKGVQKDVMDRGCNPKGKNPGDIIQTGREQELIERLFEIKKGIRGKSNYKGKSIAQQNWNETIKNCKSYRDALKILEKEIELSKSELKFLKDYVQNHLGHPKGKTPGDMIESWQWRQGMNRDEEELIEVRPNLPTQEEITEFLKEWTNGFEDTLDEEFGEHKWRHWIRKDDSGFAYPSKEDWITMKTMLKFPDNYDKQITYTELKPNAIVNNPLGSNPGDFWDITTKGYKGAHFAVFPKELVETPIKTTKEDAVIMDIFAGSGTTLEVARDLHRDSIGIEIKPDYVELMKKRLMYDKKGNRNLHPEPEVIK